MPLCVDLGGRRIIKKDLDGELHGEVEDRDSQLHGELGFGWKGWEIWDREGGRRGMRAFE